MRFLLSASVCLLALYAIDAHFYGGLYLDAAYRMAVDLRQHF
jgi:hypothetical protein